MANRIGIFGGTFDPIHLAHLLLAERARDSLQLHKVLFLPAAVPPHKQDYPLTEPKLRLEMVEMAIAGNEAFQLSDIELQRTGVSYTVDTLRELQTRFPHDELVLLLGADSLQDVPNWREPEEVIRLATLAVAQRHGSDKTDFLPFPSARIERIQMPIVEFSSTQIRNRVRLRQSIRYMVPPGIEAFIAANNLYTNENNTTSP